jgi:hypothetical protein
MLRKLLLIAILFMCVGCGNMSTWVLTGPDNDYKTLFGYNADSVEFGGLATWTSTGETEWGPEPSEIGFYVGADVSWELSANDTGTRAPFPIEILDGLTAVPYGRVEFVDDEDDDDFESFDVQFVGGTRFLLDETENVAIVVEYNGDNRTVNVGGNVRF